MTDKQTALEPCGWQFFQDGEWHNGVDSNNHRANTEAAGMPVRDVYPGPVQHGKTLYWDADDGEQGPSHDIGSLLNNIASNCDLEVGAEVHITRAIELPDMRVRVTSMPEDDDIQYEVINDGSKGGAA